MRLSTKGRYAVRAVVDLALHVNQGPVTREEIAVREEISADYLARLFAKLVKAGLISSVKGPGGGYFLAQSAPSITAGDIIRAVEEPLAPVYCVNAKAAKTCHRVDGCVTHLLWERLGDRIRELLDSVTLEDLCEQAQQIQSQRNANLEDRAAKEARLACDPACGMEVDPQKAPPKMEY